MEQELLDNYILLIIKTENFHRLQIQAHTILETSKFHSMLILQAEPNKSSHNLERLETTTERGKKTRKHGKLRSERDQRLLFRKNGLNSRIASFSIFVPATE